MTGIGWNEPVRGAGVPKTVPLALAVRPGEKAWFVGEKHGGLPNNGRVIAAVVDLLRTGATKRLPQTVSRLTPTPPHAGQAPFGLLNEKSRGSSELRLIGP